MNRNFSKLHSSQFINLSRPLLFIFLFSSNLVHPEEILAAKKLFTNHCVRAYLNKSQFYWFNCLTGTIADLVNITVAYCNYYGTGKTLRNRRESYIFDLCKNVGFFWFNGQRYHQHKITTIFKSGYLVMIFLSGQGWPKGGTPKCIAAQLIRR